jgi:hypothetical protein
MNQRPQELHLAVSSSRGNEPDARKAPCTRGLPLALEFAISKIHSSSEPTRLGGQPV